MFCFFCKQKTADEVRSGDWSSDVCSSDLLACLDTDQPNRSLDPFRLRPGCQHVALELLGTDVGATGHNGYDAQSMAPFGDGFTISLGAHEPVTQSLGYAKIGRASCRERVCQYV